MGHCPSEGSINTTSSIRSSGINFRSSSITSPCGSITHIINEDAFLDADPRQTADSLNQTFNSTGHPAFNLGATSLSGCRSTAVPGSGSDFWNAFLADNGTDAGSAADDIMIYTAIIDPDTIGFNTNMYDFQMLVAEPGNGSQEFPGGTPTTYYFYVELT